MLSTGIVAEYNPFHNGHKLHINKAKKLTQTENIIIIMSGNFTQRGDTAIINKYARTLSALKNGASLVIELPCVFASAGAEFFASAAVKLLDDSGICSYIAFGAESDDTELLKKNALALNDESEEFKKNMAFFLKDGLSYPLARQKALEKEGIDSSFISSPNNILALEYMRAILRLNSKIQPVAIKREGNDYNQNSLSGCLSSATAIRKEIFEGNTENIKNTVPENVFEIIKKEIENGKAPVSLNLLSDILNYRLRMLSANDLTKYHGISEGLENRILSSLNENYNIYDIISAVKSKRYAFSRIQRSMLHICLDIKNEDLMRYKNNGYSPYIRVLGFRKDKKDLLGRLTKNSKIPVIVNIKNAEKELNSYGREILEKEIFADNIYSMLYPNKKFSFPNQDYTTPVVIL